MISENIQTTSGYFEQFEEQIGKDRLPSYPILYAYYQELKESFCSIIAERKSVFDQMRQLLAIDAQLQILCQLFPILDDSVESSATEIELVELSQKDSQYFFRELTGKRMNDKIPFGLIYLSEK